MVEPVETSRRPSGRPGQREGKPRGGPRATRRASILDDGLHQGAME